MNRDSILNEVSKLFNKENAAPSFVRGETPVPVSGKVLDGGDIANIVDAALDGWITSGRFTESFQKNLASYIGVRDALFVNSGSSANLVALSALTSPKLGKRALKPGDEVLTVAMGFPTTVNPIIQNGLKPVLVDVEIGNLRRHGGAAPRSCYSKNTRDHDGTHVR